MSQPRKWGQKTAWAKSFFSLEDDGNSTTASANHEQPRSAKEAKKRALDPQAVWCCRQCGWKTTLPRDRTTGRPLFVLLAQHVAHEGSEGVRAIGRAETGHEPPRHADAEAAEDTASSFCLVWCPKGPFRFCDGGVNAHPDVVETGESRTDDTTGEDSRKRGRDKQPLSSNADRAKLEHLFSPLLTSPTAAGPYVFIVVENPKTPANLGSILRAIGCFCATPHVEEPSEQTTGKTGSQVQRCNNNSVIGGLLFSGTRLRHACASLNKSTATAINRLGHTCPLTRETDAASAVSIGVTDTQHAAERIPQVCLSTLQSLFDYLAGARGADITKGAAKEKSEKGVARQAYRTVAVDLILRASSLPTYTHPFPLRSVSESSGGSEESSTLSSSPPAPSSFVFYLFGPEDGSLSSAFLRQCDEAVFMPTLGSLNLAASVNVVLYDRIAKDYRTLATVSEEHRGDALKSGHEAGDESTPRRPRATGDSDAAYFAKRNVNNHLTWQR